MGKKYKLMSTLILYLSILIIPIMVTNIVIDYQHYLQHPECSAPFSVNLISKGVVYGIPIIVGLTLSHTLKCKANKH